MQSFKLINPYTHENRIIESSLNIHPINIIADRMHMYIENFGWDISGRYVALGSYGDCVIYKNGTINLVADSG